MFLYKFYPNTFKKLLFVFCSVRVVQKNLVFVVGLPMRLADPEILKKHEYFGKFGKIHKVVINQSTSYAGSQGPSASKCLIFYLKFFYS